MPQRRSLIQLGMIPSSSPPSASALALSAAATWLAFSFVPSEAGKTVSKVHWFPSTLNGSLGASDVVCDFYADSAGSPTGASLGNSTTLASAIASATWNASTGFALAVTQGTPYWVVFRNANGSPATNFPTLRFLAGLPRGNTSFTTIAQGWSKKLSTDSGATWAGANQVESGGWMIEYADGSFEGFPVNDAAVSASQVYATRELGAIFTTHASARLSLRSVAATISKTASPTGTVRAKVYQGSTLVATSLDLPIATINANGTYPFLFASPVTLQANTSYRVVVAESTQSDASSNRYNVYEYTVKNTAGAKALGPFLGTWQRTYSTDSGATWAETDTAWPVIALLLDSDAPFASGGGGAMMINE
jgi:hypothetical protein